MYVTKCLYCTVIYLEVFALLFLDRILQPLSTLYQAGRHAAKGLQKSACVRAQTNHYLESLHKFQLIHYKYH